MYCYIQTFGYKRTSCCYDNSMHTKINAASILLTYINLTIMYIGIYNVTINSNIIYPNILFV